MKNLVFSALFLIGLSMTQSAAAAEQVWQSIGGGMNGPVNAMVVYQGSLIAGGSFTTAGGVSANRIARWNGSAWHPLGEGMDGQVLALTVHNGNLIAGGSFTTADGNTANFIARWDGSAWQAIGSGMDGEVASLTVYNTELIAGGAFTMAGGNAANRIARWDGAAWQSIGGGMTGGSSPRVNALAVYNTELVAGGLFTTAGGVTVNHIARWNGSAWQALSSGVNALFGAGVLAMTEYGGELVVGGVFSGSGVSANIRRWNGSVWSSLGSGADDPSSEHAVRSLAVYGGELIAGGAFGTMGDVPGTNRIARWDGSQWQPPLGVGMDEPVSTLTTWNGALIAGGEFTLAGGQLVNFVALTTATSTQTVCAVWQRAADDVNFDVVAMAEFNGDLIAGGLLTNAGGTPVNRIARWDGSQWHAMGTGLTQSGSPVFTPRVLDLTAFDGGLIAGGWFTHAGGVAAGGIARWNGSSWQSLGGNMGGTAPYVYSLTVYNSELIAGGFFTSAPGGVSANLIARWNGSVWQSLGSGMNTGSVGALCVYGGELIAGGSFTTAGGVTVNRIARWNGSAWQSLGSGMNTGQVSDVFEYNGDLIACGNFTMAGGVAANRIARWDGSAWHAIGVGLNSPGAEALGMYNGDLIVGGAFTSPANRIARWTGATWEPLGTGLNGVVGGILQYNGMLLVCGGFTTAGGADGTAYLARWSPNEWLNPTGGGFTNNLNWELDFLPDSPALFGVHSGANQFAVTFKSSTDTPELCVNNQNPALILGGNQLEVFSQTVVGTSQSAHLSINNGTFISPLIDVGNFGTLSGDATIVGDVYNAGVIEPSSLATRGIVGMTIDGNYQQQSSAVFIAKIRPRASGSLAVTGTASFGGTLRVEIPAGEVPDSNYQVLSSAAVDPQRNRFDLAFTTGLPAGKLAIIDYEGARDTGGGRGPGGADVNVIIVDFEGNLNLAGPTTSDISGIASAAVLADFNNDQFLDLAVTIPSLDGVAILLNEGGAGNTYTQLPLVSVGSNPADLVAANLNPGASIDLAVANEGDNSVSILANDGSGNFSLVQTVNSVGSAPVAITAAELNLAGGIDLAVANRDSNTVRLLENNGSGTFSLGATLLVGSEPLDVVAADLNSDSLADLIVVNGGSNDIMIFINSGSRSFDTQQSRAVGSRPITVLPEDLDNDKDIDLVVVNSQSSNVSLLLNNSGTFQPSVHIPLAGPPRSMAAGDIDTDGDRDLAVIIDHPDDGLIVHILRNDSTEPGQSQVTLSLQPDALGHGTNPIIVLSGDINGDRRDDIVMINGVENPLARNGNSDRGTPLGSVAVQLSDVPINLCPADVAPPGGNGQVTIADITSILSAFGLPCNNCPQDIVPLPDGDDQVTIADITFVLSAFGPCPSK